MLSSVGFVNRLTEAICRSGIAGVRGLNGVFGDEAPESEFAIDNHGQGRRLYPAHRKLLTIDDRIGTRQIHANKPIGSASSIGRRRPIDHTHCLDEACRIPYGWHPE